jgi:hypothetical protein
LPPREPRTALAPQPGVTAAMLRGTLTDTLVAQESAMDADHFAACARALATAPSRRAGLRALLALGLLGVVGVDGAGAKKGKKKKKKKPCRLVGRECCTDRDCLGEERCCGKAACGECCSDGDCAEAYPGQDLTCNVDLSCEDCAAEGALCSNDIECCSLRCFIPSGKAFGTCDMPT